LRLETFFSPDIFSTHASTLGIRLKGIAGMVTSIPPYAFGLQEKLPFYPNMLTTVVEVVIIVDPSDTLL
ncbi:Hypothetical predicted protein, partial [Mytilus galloprovincialis]